MASVRPHLGRRTARSSLPRERPAPATLLRFSETLPDRRAADAVRSRIDGKDPLGLPLSDPGFDASVPSEFRRRSALESL